MTMKEILFAVTSFTRCQTCCDVGHLLTALYSLTLVCSIVSCGDDGSYEPTLPVSPLNSQDSVLVRQLLDLGLPVVWIKTVDGQEPSYEIADAPRGYWGGSIKNATKVPGRIVVLSGDSVIYESGEYVDQRSGMTVKVRGNWSARRPKKPFKIKLQSKADMLGRQDSRFADTEWILLPFFSLNNIIGLKVNELMGFEWTPRYILANVVFNGESQGLYYLMESVKRNNDCRLKVANTGYVIELDAYWWNEDLYAMASFEEPLNYTFKYPEAKNISGSRLDYIQKVMGKAEESTRNGSYQNMIDVESFARWMLAHDILGNTDGAGSNIFITKYDNTETSLIKMGPLWDFDVIMRSEGWDEIHGRYFFKGLFANENRYFVNRYVALWDEVKDEVFEGLSRYLEKYMASELCKAVDASILLNNERWAAEMHSLPLSSTFVEEANNYFAQRKHWLETMIDHEIRN